MQAGVDGECWGRVSVGRLPGVGLAVEVDVPVPGDLLPLGDHLSASVWPVEPTAELWAGLVGVLGAAGCVREPVRLVALDDGPFRYVSDLRREVVAEGGRRQVTEEGRRLLRLGFRHRRWGWVALGLGAASTLGEPHPWEVTVSGDVLGVPPDMWSTQDRARARSLWRWLDRLVVEMGSVVGARYGGVGYEMVLPSPAALATGQDRTWWPTTWWMGPEVCERLGSAGAVAAELGEGTAVVSGSVLCRDWTPPDPARTRPLDVAPALLQRGLAAGRR